VYSGTAKELVWKLKFAGAQAAVEQMAAQMLPRLRAASGTIVVPVPTATSRVRRRGYDQARLLARQLSRESQLRYVACLSRITQAQQVGASREQRLKQLSTAFYAQKPHLIQGKHIILVDDVVTTGATLEAATTALRAAGAGRIDALVFAQA
jgi:ComF family protein